MNKSLQLVLYDQLNQSYLYDDCTDFLYIRTTKKPSSPYGPLTLHPLSLELEVDCSRHFIKELSEQGLSATWIEASTYLAGVCKFCTEHAISRVVVMHPSEPTLARVIQKLQTLLTVDHISLEIRENKQFLLSHQEFLSHFEKPPVMETFYRWMRKKKNILMDGEQPVGGHWNFDKENRKFDRHYHVTPQDHAYPISRNEALALLEKFITQKLDRFGELEDAMYDFDDQVHHSLLSSALNFGLLTPREVIKAVEHAESPINNKEGFIRQVLGRREYMYHRFWFYKDTLYTKNALNHTKSLPTWFWWPEDSPLQMHCVNHVLETVRKTGYSHHITRLMIIGNFSLLVGFNPHEVNKWFREMYIDAFERVVSPNVLGMSQYADGGNLATKPYVSSANYINKMSNYCASCFYDPKEKYGPTACPMNYLYRNFIDNNHTYFTRQPYITKNLEKLDLPTIKKQAKDFIDQLGG